MTEGSGEPPPPTPYVWEKQQQNDDDDNEEPSTQIPTVPTDVLQLWTEVGNGMEKSQTVVWKSGVDSLANANKWIRTSKDARAFVEKWMGPIMGILTDQNPGKIGPMERNCVQESLQFATLIVIQDLAIQLERNGECNLFVTVAHVLSKKKTFYRAAKQGAWNMGHMPQGLPEVRHKIIDTFHTEGGWRLMERYFRTKIATAPQQFPPLIVLIDIVTALGDALLNQQHQHHNQNNNNNSNQNRGGHHHHHHHHQQQQNSSALLPPDQPQQPQQQQQQRTVEEDVIAVSGAIMEYLTQIDDDTLKKFEGSELKLVLQTLRRIYDRLLVTRRDATYEYYRFWRVFILKLMNSPALPLKLFGWEQTSEIIEACDHHRPPPRAFMASGAGANVVNGRYEYGGDITADGYAKPNCDITYVRKVPPEENKDPRSDGAGKTLTLFRCTMRSQQKWWFLSEADEEQPGTDRDIDYYQHKSKQEEERQPPPEGWFTCRTAGADPPPRLRAIGRMVPPGQEYQTLEHQLAKWAIENQIVEQVLGDSTIHREVVARSTTLIKFLASMCDRDNTEQETGGEDVASGQPVPQPQQPPQQQQQQKGDAPTTTSNSSAGPATQSAENIGRPNQYCLQPSHLLFAWKTCTRKADAAVSAQVYQLLVSILPLCPAELSIPLLKAIQQSLRESSQGEKSTDYLSEVGAFCSALATANPIVDHNRRGGIMNSSNNNQADSCAAAALSETVREEVLNLLWSVLTHPEARTLKSYDTLKLYVKQELSVEPKGEIHREHFMRACVSVLEANANRRGEETAANASVVDEVQALRMVRLTQFVLDACPPEQAYSIAARDQGAIPLMLYQELTAFLERKKKTKGQAWGNNCRNRSPSSLMMSSGTGGGGAQQPQSSTATQSIPVSNNNDSDPSQHSVALKERLRILRYAFGLSGDPRNQNNKIDPTSSVAANVAVGMSGVAGVDVSSSLPSVEMTTAMLETLWNLCDDPDDRELLMVFIASASHSGKASRYEEFGAVVATTANANSNNNVNINNAATANSQAAHSAEQVLSPAFSENVCRDVFLNQFCSPSFSYEHLGEGGFRSFQFLFNALRQSTSTSALDKKMALDALWRVCLTSITFSVAAQAMKDLLAVYVQLTSSKSDNVAGPLPMAEQMATDDDGDESFGERIFQCLTRVKEDLQGGDINAERSSERCLRILNAAIGKADTQEGPSLTWSTLDRLSALPPDASLDDAARCLSHGMRGQSCYRRVGVLAKRPPPQQVQNQVDQLYQGRDNNPANAQPKTPERFTLDVHSLETLESVKYKVALHSQCNVTSVKAVQINGRAPGAYRTASGGALSMNLSQVPPQTVMDELGVVQGCEMIFIINDRPVQTAAVAAPAALKAPRTSGQSANDLSSVFFGNCGKFSDRLFDMMWEILECLPWKEQKEMPRGGSDTGSTDTHKLVWDLLLAMPTNSDVASRVRSALTRTGDEPSVSSDEDAMEVENTETWSQLLDVGNFNRSVYILLAIDTLLQPATETLSILPAGQRLALEKMMVDESSSFRRGFVESGGFSAVAKFFSASEGDERVKHGKNRRGKAVALRILKSCLFGDKTESSESNDVVADEGESRLLRSLSDAEGLLKSLTAMVVGDRGISSATITDVLRFLRLLFRSPRAAQSFVSLPDRMAERFLVVLLMWDDETEMTRSSSSVNAAMHIRKSVHDLLLQTPDLSRKALPWLINAMEGIEVSGESTLEYFDVLEKLVQGQSSDSTTVPPENELRDLGTIVCKKLAACPRPGSEAEIHDISTGVLCGCLRLLRALIDAGGDGVYLRDGTKSLLSDSDAPRWSATEDTTKSVFAMVPSPFGARSRFEDSTLVDLMGAIFDGFLSPGVSSSVAICCDKDSRREGFEVVAAAAKACKGGEGYFALVNRINGLVTSAAPNIRHRWGQFGDSMHSHSRSRGTSKYSGLRNQGCTCYMNSLLQQLFMMPKFRDCLCAAPLPTSLRSSGSIMSSKGADLVGKKITLQWDTSVSYDAMVEGFDESTGMHTVRYCAQLVATATNVGGGNGHQQRQIKPEDIARLPPSLPDEFVLSEGRPGRETGAFEIVSENSEMEAESTGDNKTPVTSEGQIKETEDEASSRHLLEEVQKTLIHLQEGTRGRCFDPRMLVEACGCLKLEFDVWQQNDASEFATKLLDRLEISLKKWSPSSFRYMDHTFGLKQTKQKICKECGLKTNREEKLLNIDCQIRGKTDIHEALASMTEVEIMEGSNKVFCDNCKKNTDTVLRSAISVLPNMLILSLKRFDLDFNTFETVKLNSRCAFGHTLNMKQYTLEGLETAERLEKEREAGDPSPMDTGENEPKLDDGSTNTGSLPDVEYEYRLAGVLVHAGVAQGGHYYSFIRDRNPGSDEKWYRFDDEDVSPFDPAAIETECFGGKVKKESKWPNGQVQTIESEQFANALMLFYEKVKPTDMPSEQDEEKEPEEDTPQAAMVTSTGYDVFEPDARRSNTTHRWQSFLFDGELHGFMRGMLRVCLDSCGPSNATPETEAAAVALWRPALIEMLLSFVFDVMLYSSNRSSLNEWTRMLEETMQLDCQSACSFIRRLAQKTEDVSSNWLRTFLLECPNELSRAASARVFSAAMKSTATCEEESRALAAWKNAWEEQVFAWKNAWEEQGGQGSTPMPCILEGKHAILEDTERMGASGASSVGIIISFLNVLLEAIPRCYRNSNEFCNFMRDMATTPSNPSDNNRNPLRAALLSAQIPGRLIAWVCHDRGCKELAVAFPGASVSDAVAQTQFRNESSPSTHMMPLGSNQGLHTGDLHHSRGVTFSDYLAPLEAFACMGDVPGCAHPPVIQSTEENSRGRVRYTLTEPAVKALTEVFHEYCAVGAAGMGQREIERYLRFCGVDPGPGSPQKIQEMLSRYPTSDGNESRGGTLLNLEGFLAYYQDNDTKLRDDLHMLGFRPDLSRRSPAARLYQDGDRSRLRAAAESVGLDVGQRFSEPLDFGYLGSLGLVSNTLPVFEAANSLSEPLAEYLVAAASYGQDSQAVIDRILQLIYQAPNEWNSSENHASATTLLVLLASIPDAHADSRIQHMMQSGTPPYHGSGDYAIGILQVALCFHQVRERGHNYSDMAWNYNRYVILIKELRSRSRFIRKWMDRNQQCWHFMNLEFDDSGRQVGIVNPIRGDMRGDYIREATTGMPIDHHTQSDSEGLTGMDGSDEDDDDSHYEQTGPQHFIQHPQQYDEGPAQIVVEGAGNVAVNGVYKNEGHFEGAASYAMDGVWKDSDQKFHLFQCNVSNNTKHWYISIVPYGGNPGTSSDIDFYTAPAVGQRLPPANGWIKTHEGLDPPPRLSFRMNEGGSGNNTWDNDTHDEEDSNNNNPNLVGM